MKQLFCLAAAAIVAAGMSTNFASADEPKVEVKPLVTNLFNPCGIAIQPETGHVFIADSGNLRVLRYKPGAPREERISVAISGFPKDVYGKGPMYDIGPLGLAFLDRNTLVVGGGGNVDGKELVRFYNVPDEGKIKADDMKAQAGPIEKGEQSNQGEGNFYALAVTPKGIYVTSNGDDTKGWIARVQVEDGKPGKLEPFIATKVAVGVDAPVGITVSPDGNLAVGQMGEMNVPQDSLLTMYDLDGKLLWKAETGLFDIGALAYHPKSGKLYAADFAWMDEKQGGLFRLDVKKDGDEVTVEAVKIVSLDKPAAMAFDKDGKLYVLEFGTAEEGSEKKPGRLVQITGDL